MQSLLNIPACFLERKQGARCMWQQIIPGSHGEEIRAAVRSLRGAQANCPQHIFLGALPRASPSFSPCLPFFCFATVDKQSQSCRTAPILTMRTALVHGAPPGDLDHCSPSAAAEHSRTESMGWYLDAWGMAIRRPGCSAGIGKYNVPERQDLSSCR